MSDNNINHPVLKAASVGMAWLGGMTWGELASILASIYTALLITEWLWKRLLKPYLIRSGRMKGKPRDFLDTTSAGDL
jgi:hypothetical protein